MDGPVLMQVAKLDGDLWSLTGLHNDSVELKATISCRAFVQTLLCTAQEVLVACVGRGWKNREIDILASTLKRSELEAL